MTDQGARAWVESWVGWPQDFVARKALGKAVLFGEEARMNRAAAHVVRPLEGGLVQRQTPRGEEAAVLLVRHLFEQIRPDPGQIVRAVIGVPAAALPHHRAALLEAALACAEGVQLVPEPFAVAYGLGAHSDALVIDIGAGMVELCVTRGTMPEQGDLRSRKEAGDAIDRVLLHRMQDRFPQARLSLSFAQRFKEQYGFVGSHGRRVLVDLPGLETAGLVDVTEVLRGSCESIVSPIAETTAELIRQQEPERQARIRRNLYLAGGGSRLPGLAALLQEALTDGGACHVRCVRDPLYAGAEGALALAQDLPVDAWQNR